MSKKQGFTLIEIIIVVAILAILTLASIASLIKNRDKADDSKIKSDLSKLKIAFEDYYGDYNCYPPTSFFDDQGDCSSSQLSPYMNQLVCDPNSNLPYTYQTDGSDCPQWFKVYSNLTQTTDSAVIPTPVTVDSSVYNYGVSSTNVSVYADSPNSQGEILGDGSNLYYCQTEGIGLDVNGEPNHGNCSSVTAGMTCTPSFSDSNCGNSHNCVDTVSTCN